MAGPLGRYGSGRERGPVLCHRFNVRDAAAVAVAGWLCKQLSPSREFG